MIELDFSYTDDGLIDAYVDLLGDLPELTYQAISDPIMTVSTQLEHDFQREPGAVVYPIQWKSERQRRAFFATKGFGNGIPYKRTGQLAAGWHTHILHDGQGMISIQLGNEAAALPFVEGLEQQPFHANTGWLYYPDLGARWYETITDTLETILIKLLYIQDDDRKRAAG